MSRRLMSLWLRVVFATEKRDRRLSSFPKEGALPAPVTSGKYYYLYVLKDVGFVLERCLFEAP